MTLRFHRSIPPLRLAVLAAAAFASGALAASTAPPHRATTPHRTTTPARAGAPATNSRFAPSDSLPLDPHVRTGVLPNGLRYFIRANHKPEKRVALRLAVNAGSNMEADDQRGLAHLCEHMNFDGSEHFAPEQLVDYLESIGLRFGADANAYTSFDETVYMLDVPTDRDTVLDRGVEALSDFAGRATFTTPQIDKERGVVLEEWRLGRGAGERLQRKQFPVLYNGSHYAERLPIGLPEIIRHAPNDRLRAFYHDWYTPDRMAVIAVGDVDPDRMERLIRTHFGSLPRNPAPRPTPVWRVPPHAATLVSADVDSEATSSRVSVSFARPREPLHTVADYRRDVLLQLYGSMWNDRLDEITHRADAPFLAAGGFETDLGRGDECWRLGAAVKDGGIERGLRALMEEAERVRRHGFLPAELARAREDLRAGIERAYAERDKQESPELASDYVSYALTGDAEPGIEREHALTLALLDGITLDEIDALTAELMPDSNRVVLASAPAQAGAPVPTPAALLAALADAARANPVAWVDSTSGKALMPPLAHPGTIVAKRTVPELGATVLTLSNGVQVWLKPTTFSSDAIVFGAFARGGTSLADSARYTEAWMTPLVMSDAGLGGFTDTELRKLLAGRIAGVSPSYGPYTHGVDGSARPEDLDTALQLTYLLFTQPTRDPAAFAALRQRLHSQLADRANSPEAVYADTVQAVNSGRFYMDRVPTLAEIDAVSLDRVLAFHRRLFANAADFTFAFAGNFDADSIGPRIARYLGALPSTGHPTSELAPVGPRYPDHVTQVQVRKGVEPKATVLLTFFTRGAAVDERDMHRARACASILQEHLRQRLRELLGGTYSAHVGFGTRAPLAGWNTMSVRFGCDPARLDTLVAATLSEIRSLREDGPSEDDLRKDQEIERRELEVSLEQNGYWEGSILSCLELGIDPLRITHRRERIDALTRTGLHDTFRKYFPLDRYSVVSLVPATAPRRAEAQATTP